MMMETVSRTRMRIMMETAFPTRTTLMMMVTVSWMVRRMTMVTVLSMPRMLMTTMTVGLKYFKVRKKTSHFLGVLDVNDEL